VPLFKFPSGVTALTLVSFTEISKSFSGELIFAPATGIIRRGDRIGVVGPNGAGKTTFCRVLAGLDRPDTGEVHREKKLRLSYMEQEPELDSEQGVLDELLASCSEITHLETKIREYGKRLDSGEKLHGKELERYGEMLDRFERLGGYSLASRAEKILTGLGLEPETFSQRVNSLSGGQKSRLALAIALIREPDLLFLDEPTNHLDLRGIEFLENFLLETSSTVVVISHDRALLDKVTGRTIEILDSHVTIRPGNYSEFSRWAHAEAGRLERARKNYERKVEKIEEFIRRNICGQKTKQAQSRRKMLARLKPPPAGRRVRRAPDWGINVSRKSASMVIEASGVSMAWPGREALFENLDLTLMRGETLAVIGDNGTGKSTLIEILAGKISPQKGRVSLGREVNTAHLPQRVSRPAGLSSVLEFMQAQAPELTLGELRNLLARFLFLGEQVEQSVDSLSEGEFRRLLLAGLIHSGANLLLLDEPTNHLDIYSREALQSALGEYSGTMVLITHDRELLSALATRILEFSPTGSAASAADKVVEYAGDYSYYKQERAKLEHSLIRQQGKGPARPSRAKKTDTGSRQLSKNELRKLKERKALLEGEIDKLESRMQEFQLELADPLTYKQQGRAAELAAALETLKGEIEKAYKEWERLLEYD